MNPEKKLANNNARIKEILENMLYLKKHNMVQYHKTYQHNVNLLKQLKTENAIYKNMLTWYNVA